MGSPLYPIPNTIYMEEFENIQRKAKKCGYGMYIDDTFVIWPHDEVLNGFLQNLNNIENTIKFII